MRVYVVMATALALVVGTIDAGAAQQRSSDETTRILDQVRVTLKAYVDQGSKEDETKCTGLVDQVLARGDLTPKDLIAAAQAARVLKQWPKALAAVERRLAKYPDAQFPDIENSERLVSQFWIAAIAREGGDVQRACAAYDKVLADSAVPPGTEDTALIKIAASLLKADLLAITGNVERAKEVLRARPAYSSMDNAIEEWAHYYLDKLEKGAVTSQRTLVNTVALKKTLVGMVDTFLIMEGCGVEIPIKYGPKSEGSWCMLRVQSESAFRSVMTDMATFRLGVWHLSGPFQDFEKSRRYLTAVSQGDSFLAPEAGLVLLRCANRQLKESNIATDTTALVQDLKTRFPGYVPAIDELVSELSATK